MPTGPSTTRSKDERISYDAETTISVLAWRDHIVESHPESHPTSSNDTLVWWSPILGPTATLMAHRFAGYVAHGDQMQFTLADLARTFGMGQSMGRVRASFQRLERFGIISLHDQTLFVRTALPPLTRRHLEQLPPYLVELYERRRSSLRATPGPGDPSA
jgi:hypothetical protein